MKFINQEQLKAQSSGHWVAIMHALAPDLSDALSKNGRHVPCPVHGGKDGFRLVKDFNLSGIAFSNKDGKLGNGFKLLQWLFGCSYREAIEMVDDYFAGSIKYDNTVRHLAPVQKANTGDFSKVLKLWNAGMTVAQAYHANAKSFSVVKSYFESRGLNIGLVKDEDVRLVDNLVYGKDDAGNFIKFAGFVCAVRNVSGEIQTLHRFFLDDNGHKANVENPKKMMAIADGKTVTGAAIRFGKPVDGILAIAEGVETALSVVAGTGLACWSCLTAHGVSTFEPPESVKTIVVFADKDVSETGAKAVSLLKERMAAKGVKVLKVFPKLEIAEGSKGVDWNDALLQKSDFPSFDVIKRYAA